MLVWPSSENLPRVWLISQQLPETKIFLQFDKSENTDEWGIVQTNTNNSISNLLNPINDPQLNTMKQIVEKNPKEANNQLAIALYIYKNHEDHKEECLQYCNRAIEYAEKHKKNS